MFKITFTERNIVHSNIITCSIVKMICGAAVMIVLASGKDNQ